MNAAKQQAGQLVFYCGRSRLKALYWSAFLKRRGVLFSLERVGRFWYVFVSREEHHKLVK